MFEYLGDIASENYEDVLLPVAKELHQRNEEIRLLNNRIIHLNAAIEELRASAAGFIAAIAITHESALDHPQVKYMHERLEQAREQAYDEVNETGGSDES